MLLHTYIPPHFSSSIEAFTQINALPEKDGVTGYFGQLLSVCDSLCLSFAPVYRSGDNIYFHLAAANPHCDLIVHSAVHFIAMGAHGYISPNLLQGPAVPTWNYSALMLTGRCREINEPAQQLSLLQQLVELFEDEYLVPERGKSVWQMAALSEENLEAMRAQLRFFVMRIDQVEAKAKLSQNRTSAEIHQAISLLKSAQPELAQAMDAAQTLAVPAA